MSYILEALKKAERQRELGHVPGIDVEQAPLARPRRYRGLWLVLLLLAVNAGLLVALLGPESPKSTGKQVNSAAVQPLSQRQERVPPPSSSGAPVAASQPPSTASSVPARSVVTAVVSRPAAPRRAPAPPVSQPAPPPEPAPVAARAEPIALPVWPQIPQALFAQLQGGLRLDVHVYAKQPEHRFVLINMKKYYQGEKLQQGPLLEEITPEGVVLSFRGERFRVLAQ